MTEDDLWGCIGFIFATAVLVTGIVLLALVIMGVVAHVSLDAKLDRIEQLRADAAVVDPAQAEDVIGQVAETNQQIRSNQAYNRIFILGLTVPDEWDAVETIEVPRGE